MRGPSPRLIVALVAVCLLPSCSTAGLGGGGAPAPSPDVAAGTPSVLPSAGGGAGPGITPPAAPTVAVRVERVAVSRVVDGDTIHVKRGGGTERVRLIGIDTPESTTRHEPYGKEASDYTKRLVNGKTVFLELDVDERDRYGRLLAYVWLSPPASTTRATIRSSMLNAILVRDGYAQMATYPPNVRYVDHFRDLQAEARREGRGLWGSGGSGS